MQNDGRVEIGDCSNVHRQEPDMSLSSILVLALLGSAQQPAVEPAADALQIQVMLDRAGFSPGSIDGRMGRNTKRALELFKAQGGNPAANFTEALTRYVITDADVGGPYTPDISSDLVEQSKLPALGYKTIVEALAERFHSSPALIRRLNPGATFAAGEEIVVPNVPPLVMPVERIDAAPGGEGTKPTGTSGHSAAEARQAMLAKPDVSVTVRRTSSDLTVTDTSGKIVMYAPVTLGSEHDPLPIGEWKVNGVQMNPPFRYNPDLFWDADPSHTKVLIPPGPNNPVGLVWVDISKEHYGIHGTPEPEAIGRTESHGCIRLTNWDALKLAGLVKPGTQVVFKD
jgi:lipoprotein-anchoring transpeptidase ErfK/SrfK